MHRIGSACLVTMILMGCTVRRTIPDMSFQEAAEAISGAPEFSRYARLVTIESLDHWEDSMDTVTFGRFTFLYLNAPPDMTPIEGEVEFMFHEGNWYLNQFDYGGRGDRHVVNVYDGPNKRR